MLDSINEVDTAKRREGQASACPFCNRRLIVSTYRNTYLSHTHSDACSVELRYTGYKGFTSSLAYPELVSAHRVPGLISRHTIVCETSNGIQCLSLSIYGSTS